jgi:antitoxin PrlF
MATRTVLRSRGQVTVPEAIRRAANLQPGDPIDVELTEDGILLRPIRDIDPSQAWFWTPEWQRGEREASVEIAAGRVCYFESDEEFEAALDAIDAELDR